MVRIFYIVTVMFFILFVTNVAAYAIGVKTENERIALRFRFAAAITMSLTIISLIVTLSLFFGG